MYDLDIIPHKMELESVRSTGNAGIKIYCKSILENEIKFKNSSIRSITVTNANHYTNTNINTNLNVPLSEYIDKYDNIIYKFMLLKYKQQLQLHSSRNN